MEQRMTKTEKAVQMYAELIIKKMETLKTDWRKPWFSQGCLNEPRSIDGRRYHTMNAFLLLMVCEMEQYKHPVFVTFNRVSALGAKVRKGAKSVPVFFWMLQAKNTTTGEYIDIANYNDMSQEEKSKYDLKPFLRCNNVFNIEQTTIEQDAPKVWERATKGDALPKEQSADGMFACPSLDELIMNQSWICPIEVVYSHEAFYSISKDIIQIPEKSQYDVSEDRQSCGMEYYSTLLHEMAHSTGAKSCLGRCVDMTHDNYGREELVAELTSAVCGASLGFSSHVKDNSAAYIKNWIESIEEKPTFLISVLSDVAKAVDMIREYVGGIELNIVAP